jgi:signal transduction histidine kinase
MKKKIIIGLALYAAVFLGGGLYILKVMNDVTSRMDQLVMMHQVEILREHFLIQLRRVQNSLAVRGTHHAEDFDEFVSQAQRMSRVMGTCSECHHHEPVASRLEELRRHTDVYKQSLSRVLTMQADPARMEREQDVAYHIGESLVSEVSEMIATTGPRLEASTARAFREIEQTKLALYAIVGIGPLAAAGLGWVLISGLTRPVRVLVSGARRFQNGDLDHRVENLKDEFGELGAAINDMASSLTDHMTKMRRAEQMAVVGQLSAGLAHEIKNPLAGIKVAMRVLEDEGNLSGEDRTVMRKVGSEIERLESLMKSFLNFAKPPKPQLAEVDVNTVVTTSLGFHANRRPGAAAGFDGVKIVKDLGSVPLTLADPMQLQQVLLNLVINSMEAMPEGGELRVSTRLDEAAGSIRIEVADSGRGVDPGDAERIFEPFFTTKHGGTGLGLAISRQLIEQQDGSLTLRPGDGGGTVFTILLPVRARSVPQSA